MCDVECGLMLFLKVAIASLLSSRDLEPLQPHRCSRVRVHKVLLATEVPPRQGRSL